MKDLESQKLTWKQYLVVASLLFGLFFGAGNLIFPLHLGQLAGSNWGTATVGFLITGVLLPLLSVLAVAITRSEGVYDIGKPLGAGFAIVFMVLIHATIGPLFGTPRTATVSFTVGVAPFIPKNMQTPALLIFSALFFVAAFAQDFHKHFPKVSYHAWLALSCLASFLTANFGLDQIIAWSTPMLMFLYPLSMVLIILSVCSPLFKKDGVVYFFVILFTVVPALGDMVVAFPSVVSQSSFGLAVASVRNTMPLASMGLSWLVPALVGAVIGLTVHFVRGQKVAQVEDELE